MPIANIGISPTSAKGDILSSDGSSRSRVAVGTNGQILTARSSSASGLQHESASASPSRFVVIASSKLTAASQTIEFTSIPTTYRAIKIIAQNSNSTTGGAAANILLNSNSSKTYNYSIYYRNNATRTTLTSSSSPGMYLAEGGETGSGSNFEIDILQSTNSTFHTILRWRHSVTETGSTHRLAIGVARVNLGALITSIKFILQSTDTFGKDSTYTILGRNY
jgi:hypothetical protein